MNVFAAVSGTDSNFGTGAIVALVSIVMVFVILALIIGVTYLVAYFINKVPSKELKSSSEAKASTSSPLNLNDEDATVAALVASIECREETKKNVKVISVKEIK